MLLFIVGALYQFFFRQNFASSAQIDGIQTGEQYEEIYNLSPEQFTLAFSVLDDNADKVSEEQLARYIGFYYAV